MTQPDETPEVVLTAEHQDQVDALYNRIEQYQQDHYQPATGWPKESLAYPVRQALDKADNAAPQDHTHGADDFEGLNDFMDSALSGYSKNGHQHSVSDLSGTSVEATAGTVPLRDSTGGFEVIDPARPSQPANKRYVDQEAGKKANTTHNHSLNQVLGLQTILDTKTATGHTHGIDDVRGLREALSNGGGGGSVDPEVLLTKADLVNGTVPEAQIPRLPLSKITNLNTELESRPQAVNGRYPKSVFPVLGTSDISGLDAFITSQTNTLKLVGGLVPTENLPGAVFQKVVRVSTTSEMTSLTSSQVSNGDVAVVTGGAGVGTYQLSGNPNTMSSWIKYATEQSVSSVNGKTGAVTLVASDVGARPAGNIPMADVSGLNTALSSKADSSALVGLPTPEQLNELRTSVSNQNYSYHPVDFVATTRITTLSGQQSVDGTLLQAGRRVLVTNQSSSAQNGIWVTSTTAWYRDTSMPEDSVVPKGALVAVKSGTDNANTLWQMRNSVSAKVGTDSQNWHKILTAGGGGIDFTVGNGLRLDNGTLSVRAGGNITVTSNGVSLDTTGLMRKWSGDIPGGSAVASINHSLNTRDVYVAVYEVSTGDQVLVGVTITGVNTVAIEFATAPSNMAFRCVVFG